MGTESLFLGHMSSHDAAPPAGSSPGFGLRGFLDLFSPIQRQPSHDIFPAYDTPQRTVLKYRELIDMPSGQAFEHGGGIFFRLGVYDALCRSHDLADLCLRAFLGGDGADIM